MKLEKSFRSEVMMKAGSKAEVEAVVEADDWEQ
jgi:hypothetical protein